jgi:hypothetical protein
MAAQFYLLLTASEGIVGAGSQVATSADGTAIPLPPHCIPCTQTQAETWQTLEVVSGVIQAIPAATLLAT